jgi:aspartate-semialdehyde dehydrogenase
MKIAVVGATGLVGGVMLQVLQERKFPYTSLLLVASERSVGEKILVAGKEYTVTGLEDAIKEQPDLAIFSAGGDVSLAWAPRFTEVGTTVIDNSSAWRMNVSKKLVVPEINAHLLTKEDKIIANPNCSTIQMVLALAPLHKAFGIKRVVVSTYQSVTGTGVKAVRQMEDERKGIQGEKAYPHPIDLNCFPHGGSFEENGYTTEETKLLNETRKILGNDKIQVTATVVRIPTYGGHSEAVNVEFERDFELNHVRQLLTAMPGVVVVDNPVLNEYPTPLTARDRDEVFVGRIRRDFSQHNTLNLWIVSDNLRKGAATNALQIAEYLVDNGLV